MVKRSSFEEPGRSRKRSRLDPNVASSGRDHHQYPPGTSVYVGNLDYKTSWQDLKDHMRKAGNVNSVKILSSDTGRSKGCAVVLYQNPKEAQRAIRELTDSVVNGRKIFVREDRDGPPAAPAGGPPPSSRHEQGGGGEYNHNFDDASTTQLYVGNLSYTCTWYELKDFFRSEVGDHAVDHAEVVEGGDGRKKGFGIVKFTSFRAAEDAIRRLDGAEFQGRKLFLRFDRKPDAAAAAGHEEAHHHHGGRGRGGGGSGGFASTAAAAPPSRHQHQQQENDSTQIYVGNLSFDTKWYELKDYFREEVGDSVEHAEVVEGTDGRKKGFGIVKFTTHRNAEAAIQLLDGKEFQGRKLYLKFDRRSDYGGAADGPTNNKSERREQEEGGGEDTACFVGNLSYDSTWQDLKNYFNKVGNVQHADVVEGADGRKKGFGIVIFNNSKDATKAIRQLDGTEFLGRKIEVRLDKRGGQKPESSSSSQKPHGNNDSNNDDDDVEPMDFQEKLGTALKAAR